MMGTLRWASAVAVIAASLMSSAALAARPVISLAVYAISEPRASVRASVYVQMPKEFDRARQS